MGPARYLATSLSVDVDERRECPLAQRIIEWHASQLALEFLFGEGGLPEPLASAGE
jgi:hypothetical protein